MKNEFRIGNFIKINNPTYRESQVGHICRTNEIREDGLNLTDVDISSRPIFGQLWKFIEPIELTEEWLIKFGFISNRRLREKQFKSKAVDGDVRLTLWIGTNGEGFYYADCVRIKYVHQLQNLYFAISGEEIF